MANIFKPKYGDGHKIVLKSNIAGNVKTILTKNGFTPGKTVFDIIRKPVTNKQIKAMVQLTNTGESINLRVENTTKIYRFIGAKTTIQNLFDHFGKGTGKSATDKKTQTKELVSMCVMEQNLRFGKTIDEDFVEDCLPKDLKQYYTSIYYSSAISQLQAFKNKLGTKFRGDFIYERQAFNVTKKMYEVAQKISGLQKDNWNPADIWLIKRGFSLKDIESSKNIDELNMKLIQAYKKGQLVGISLKQVTAGKGQISFINEKPGQRPEVNMNFDFARLSLSESFNNAILETKDKFGVRIGYKAAADNYNVYLEGRMIGSGVNMGAINAKEFPGYVKEKYGYTVRKEPVEPNVKDDYETARKEYEQIYKKYSPSLLSNTIKDYKDLIAIYDKSPVFMKKRFIKLVTFIYPYLISTFKKGGNKEFNNFMMWNYFQAKKITDKGGFYILLS